MTDDAQEHDGSVRVPLAEERIVVAKEVVTTGKATVRTVTEIHEHLVSERLTHEHVDVERVAINRIVDVAPQLRTEGDVTIVPVVEERIVVSKHLVLVEEVRIRRRVEVENVELPVALRKQVAEIHEEKTDVER